MLSARSCGAPPAAWLLAAALLARAAALPEPAGAALLARAAALPEPAGAALLARAAALPEPAGAALLARAAALPEPAGAALRCRGAARCSYVGGSGNEHQYQVEGKNIIVEHSAGSYLKVLCNKFSVLDSPALPRAGSELDVTTVTLTGCPPPASRSLADTLAALNVSLIFSPRGAFHNPLGNLVLEELPHTPPLAERHFLGLEGLPSLILMTKMTVETVKPERGFLKPLRNLNKLVIERVTLPPDELEDPPIHLQTLRLQHTGVEQVLPQALLVSTNLRSLTLGSNSALSVSAVPPGLLGLNVWSPATTLRLDAAPALSSLTLSHWVDVQNKSLSGCHNLTTLRVISPAVRKLPKHLLANCSRLEKLEIQYAKNLTSLPLELLMNTSALTVLSIKQSALETLPNELLHYVPRLLELHLTDNHLRTLPSGLFAVAQAVQVLKLSSNELNGTTLDALSPLVNLTTLDLSRNPGIGDICGTMNKSPMRDSTKLTELNLSRTSVRHICSDWRSDMMELKVLDLTNTNVSELWFENIQLMRNVDAVVLLAGAPVTVMGMTRQEYKSALKEMSIHSGRAKIYGLENLACDCRMFWTRLALAAINQPLKHVTGMRCAGGRALGDMQPEDLLCTDNENAQECAQAAPPAQCACGWQPDENPLSSRWRVRVDCSGRGLTSVPRLRTAPDARRRLYQLLLRDNRISDLDARSLRPDIIELDLRNNSLEKVKAETVEKLGSFGGVLLLAGNSLDCSCSAVSLLRVLSSRANRTDLSQATCRGGRVSLSAAPRVDCVPLLTWAACAIAALLTLAVAAIVFLWSRERRFFIKAVLHRWGCYWYPAETEEDDGRRYDAFVTFSHKDEPMVLELIARLEPPYRLCVHYRDWIPGRYITEQVVESVQDSRRTIALVSQHFLESGWALAEFRQAHAAAMLEARPRLVVVLLEDPSTLELDEQLSRYLSTNTYVRWGDPWFWDKLALALPRPRPHVTAPTPNSPPVKRRPPPTRTAAAKRAARRPSAAARAPAPSPTRTADAPLTAHSLPASAAAYTTSPAPPVHVVSSAQTRLSVKQPDPNTKVTISTDDSDPSPVINSSLTSTKELVLTPPRLASTYASWTQDVTSTAREVTPEAREVTPTTREVKTTVRWAQETPRPTNCTPHRPAVAVLT